MRRRFAIVAAILMLGALIAGQSALQKRLSGQGLAAQKLERFSDLPADERIKPWLLGYETTYANYLWIKTVLYFGSHNSGDKDYRWLCSMLDIVTRLNPRFYPAYEFAGLILPEFTDRQDAARIILERGVTELGSTRYKIPFFRAMLEMNHYSDTATAAHYMLIAARDPKAPPYIVGLAATLLNKSERSDLAAQFLMAAYESAENPAVKRTVLDKLKKMGLVAPL